MLDRKLTAFPASRASCPGWVDPDAEFWGDGFTDNGVTAIGPCAMNCKSSNELYSFHGSVCHASMCDGSVRFMSADTPVSVVDAWVSSQLSEIVPNED